MSLIAEFSVSSPKLALYDATTQVPSVTVEVTSQMAVGGAQPVLFFWVRGDDDGTFKAALAEDWTVAETECYTDLGDRQLYRVQLSDDVDVLSYPVWVEAGASRLGATCQAGIWRNRMRFPDREAFATVRQWCAEHDLAFRLYALYTATGQESDRNGNGLSAEQERTLRVAYEAGYYEIPQEATGAEIAAELGVSQQAVSERLRRAYATLIEEHVLSEPESDDIPSDE